ncbi:MAG: DUF309 domain-containing protein [Niallia nealsonii]|nr:DUF309 domain-containing protein [Niallia nealsonii]
MYPTEYMQFLVHFHGDQDFFECHEILEDFWKKVDSRNKESIWVGFILIAVSCYHHRRKNFTGAEKTIQKSRKLLEKKKEAIRELGLDDTSIILLLKNQEDCIKNKQIFFPYHLPISDSQLERKCAQLAHSMGMKWKKNEPIPLEIIHRHVMRDRSIVIKEREQALKKKKRQW